MKDILIKHNLFWGHAGLDTGVPRSLLHKLLESLEVKHIVAISGARRSGKSYLFRQIQAALLDQGIPAENLLQINFEDPFFISRAEDPQLLTELFTTYLSMKNPQGLKYLFLDEIQNIKDWQYWLRDVYDRRDDLKIFITGSNAELLSVELNTHLTGRVLAYENFPFSFPELLHCIDSDKWANVGENNNVKQIYEHYYSEKEALTYYLEKTFNRGYFPEVAALENEELVKDILVQYFENVIFKDIIPRFSIRNTKVIEQLGYYLSTNFTSSFSYHKLAEAIGTNENTAKEYLTYYEKAYLFFPVEYYEYSLKKQFKRNKKIYIIDSGLRNATALKFSEDYGRYVENIIFNRLRLLTKKIYYWYTEKTKIEIDFIVDINNRKIAINVCYTDNIPQREFDAFKELPGYNIKVDRQIIITKNTFYTITIADREIELIPAWCFLLAQDL